MIGDLAACCTACLPVLSLLSTALLSCVWLSEQGCCRRGRVRTSPEKGQVRLSRPSLSRSSVLKATEPGVDAATAKTAAGPEVMALRLSGPDRDQLVETFPPDVLAESATWETAGAPLAPCALLARERAGHELVEVALDVAGPDRLRDHSAQPVAKQRTVAHRSRTGVRAGSASKPRSAGASWRNGWRRSMPAPMASRANSPLASSRWPPSTIDVSPPSATRKARRRLFQDHVSSCVEQARYVGVQNQRSHAGPRVRAGAGGDADERGTAPLTP